MVQGLKLHNLQSSRQRIRLSQDGQRSKQEAIVRAKQTELAAKVGIGGQDRQA